MRVAKVKSWVAGCILCLTAIVTLGIPTARAAEAAQAPASGPDLTNNAICLGCHGNKGFEAPGPDGKMRSLYVPPEKFKQSEHGAFPCVMCHDYIKSIPHNLTKKESVNCGKCHVAEEKAYDTSIHAKERARGNPKAPYCYNCHTTHTIASPKAASTKLLITKECGTCHKENFITYTDTYHGQVDTLGYAYTAKCFDCHSNHAIQRVTDPRSPVYPTNRLKTCHKCHAGAPKGFASFNPHANTHDFKNYPYMWIASKFMIALLFAVFGFFWMHSVLWFYREFKEGRERKERTFVMMNQLQRPPAEKEKYIRRFGPLWRVAHLLFALSVMTLVLTGMTLFYADTAWAQAVIRFIGGPRVEAIVHRTAAAIMLSIFFIHLVYMVVRIVRHRKTFDWFGPDSLVPRWKDLHDAVGMFRWFFGKGPRPTFDKWTYWEKFDYWAVFWGMAVIGTSGMMLAFPYVTASFLPGWVFNVATLIHGEEAFLAAVFLFTVHFFNNHFRPDHLPPPDIVIFTGASPLEEFKREHTLEYQRLVESGELEKHLVDVPSRPMTIGSTILGIVLIAIGLTLLVLVLNGLYWSLTGPH